MYEIHWQTVVDMWVTSPRLLLDGVEPFAVGPATRYIKRDNDQMPVKLSVVGIKQLLMCTTQRDVDLEWSWQKSLFCLNHLASPTSPTGWGCKFRVVAMMVGLIRHSFWVQRRSVVEEGFRIATRSF